MYITKLITIFALTLLSINCSPFLSIKNNKIYEGIGFNHIEIDKTTKSDVLRKFGYKYREYGGGSYDEISYEQKGIGFRGKWWSEHSNLQEITLALNKINGTTSKGLKANRNTKIKDVFKIYGEPKDRYGDEVYISRYDDGTFDEVSFYLDYPQLGISFYVTPKLHDIKDAENMTDQELIAISLDIDSFYLNQPINAIILYKKE